MCGIFALINNDHCKQHESGQIYSEQIIKESFNKGQGRGPEHSVLKDISKNITFGFHRLAINGLDDISNQPIIIDDISLICNGEIYNYKELYALMSVEPKTHSDCEVIIHLYKTFGIEYTLNLLDGVFAFVLFDQSSGKVFVARDPYGVRPLYMMTTSYMNCYGFASELKVLTNLNKKNNSYEQSGRLKQEGVGLSLLKYNQFKPGSYMIFSYGKHGNDEFMYVDKYSVKYHNFAFNKFNVYESMIYDSGLFDMNSYVRDAHIMLDKAVKKRVIGTTERPVACLLSGGLDSSLIAALVNKHYKAFDNSRVLETYSIGMEGSEDLRYAKIVAKHLGTKHTEIIVTEDEFFDAIPEVIKAIESYDTTSVRASVGNYLLGKYIAAHSEAKVIFNGDGSDELAGGYLYFHACPSDLHFDMECKRLLSDIYAFDVLRSDKSISSHGLEPRTPFLDRGWVDYYLSIPAKLRNHNNEAFTRHPKAGYEKFIIRLIAEQYLPSEVAWRRKEAFSDGVSGQKSWYQIIQDKLQQLRHVRDVDDNPYEFMEHNRPSTKEQIYYRTLFDEFYPDCENVVPYFWMPKWVESNDASARTLSIYSKLQN